MSKASLKKRLKKLEESAKASVRSQNRWLDEDWAEFFEKEEVAREFVGEPDYPEAVSFFRDAIRDAADSACPPFEPPKDFMRGEPANDRRFEWRVRKTFPMVDSAFFWLYEMVSRVRDGKPPVTEAEYRDLEAWFHENEHRIPPNEGIEVGEGRRLSRTNLRVGLKKGPRTNGVTELVEDLRRLRAVLD